MNAMNSTQDRLPNPHGCSGICFCGERVEAVEAVEAVEFNTFKKIRKALFELGLIDGMVREQGPYYYSRNGGTKRERSPGIVANIVRKMAQDEGIVSFFGDIVMRECSWSGKWRRTVQSLTTESEGINAFWNAVEALEKTPGGLLGAMKRRAQKGA